MAFCGLPICQVLLVSFGVKENDYKLKQQVSDAVLKEQFLLAGQSCAKTFEAMAQDSTLFNLSLERIIMGKVTDGQVHLGPLSYEEEFKCYGDKIKDFL
ncbi:MAG: hypothetical protein EOP51_02340, partial [Sphingobacteriales bacterium]